MTSLQTRVHRTRVILVLFTRPIHRGDELNAFQPWSIQKLQHYPQLQSLKRTGHHSKAQVNLLGGCRPTISTPTGSRNAAPADHEFVLFCGSSTTYLSHLLPSATIGKITILFAAETRKRSDFSFVMEQRETKQNYRLGKADIWHSRPRCRKHEQ